MPRVEVSLKGGGRVTIDDGCEESCCCVELRALVAAAEAYEASTPGELKGKALWPYVERARIWLDAHCRPAAGEG